MRTFRHLLFLIALAPSLIAPIKEHSIIVDARAEKFIHDILSRLCRASGRLSVPKIYFIVDKSINAFATDEAKIYIHTGMIIKFKNVNQLCAVLAHELGHITGGHMHRFSSELNAVNAASIIGTLLGGAAALAGGGAGALMAGSMLGQNAAMGTFASFSRTHEKEADAAGFRMMQKANLNTEGFIETFELFKKMNSFGDIPYLQTHPSDQDRINAFLVYRDKSPDHGQTPPEWQEEFEIIQALFMANLNKPSEVERTYYRKQTTAAHIAKIVVLAKKGQYREACSKLQEMIAKSPNDPYLHEMCGQFLLEGGQAAEALTYLKKAVNLAPNALSIRLLFAQALYTSSTDNAQEAIDHLNRITQDDPDNVMAWLLKVGAYRKLNEPDHADLAQAEAAIRTGDTKLAIQRAKRASKSQNPKVAEQAKMLLENHKLDEASHKDF